MSNANKTSPVLQNINKDKLLSILNFSMMKTDESASDLRFSGDQDDNCADIEDIEIVLNNLLTYEKDLDFIEEMEQGEENINKHSQNAKETMDLAQCHVKCKNNDSHKAIEVMDIVQSHLSSENKDSCNAKEAVDFLQCQLTCEKEDSHDVEEAEKNLLQCYLTCEKTEISKQVNNVDAVRENISANLEGGSETVEQAASNIPNDKEETSVIIICDELVRDIENYFTFGIAELVFKKSFQFNHVNEVLQEKKQDLKKHVIVICFMSINSALKYFQSPSCIGHVPVELLLLPKNTNKLNDCATSFMQKTYNIYTKLMSIHSCSIYFVPFFPINFADVLKYLRITHLKNTDHDIAALLPSHNSISEANVLIYDLVKKINRALEEKCLLFSSIYYKWFNEHVYNTKMERIGHKFYKEGLCLSNEILRNTAWHLFKFICDNVSLIGPVSIIANPTENPKFILISNTSLKNFSSCLPFIPLEIKVKHFFNIRIYDIIESHLGIIACPIVICISLCELILLKGCDSCKNHDSVNICKLRFFSNSDNLLGDITKAAYASSIKLLGIIKSIRRSLANYEHIFTSFVPVDIVAFQQHLCIKHKKATEHETDVDFNYVKICGEIIMKAFRNIHEWMLKEAKFGSLLLCDISKLFFNVNENSEYSIKSDVLENGYNVIQDAENLMFYEIKKYLKYAKESDTERKTCDLRNLISGKVVQQNEDAPKVYPPSVVEESSVTNHALCEKFSDKERELSKSDDKTDNIKNRQCCDGSTGEMEKLWELHLKECYEYRANPGTHPFYKEEYFKFMQSRSHPHELPSGSLQAQIEWQFYWPTRLEQLFEIAWHEKKLNSFNLNMTNSKRKLQDPVESSPKRIKIPSKVFEDVVSHNDSPNPLVVQTSNENGKSDSVSFKHPKVSVKEIASCIDLELIAKETLGKDMQGIMCYVDECFQRKGIHNVDKDDIRKVYIAIKAEQSIILNSHKYDNKLHSPNIPVSLPAMDSKIDILNKPSNSYTFQNKINVTGGTSLFSKSGNSIAETIELNFKKILSQTQEEQSVSHQKESKSVVPCPVTHLSNVSEQYSEMHAAGRFSKALRVSQIKDFSKLLSISNVNRFSKTVMLKDDDYMDDLLVGSCKKVSQKLALQSKRKKCIYSELSESTEHVMEVNKIGIDQNVQKEFEDDVADCLQDYGEDVDNILISKLSHFDSHHLIKERTLPKKGTPVRKTTKPSLADLPFKEQIEVFKNFTYISDWMQKEALEVLSEIKIRNPFLAAALEEAMNSSS